jgi:hypothetical protein
MKHVTPMQAIRAKCLDCTCQQPKEVRLCTVKQCPLWPYRMGKRLKKEVPQELVAVNDKA